MAFLNDLISVLIILSLGFAIYMKAKNKSLRDVIVEIKEGFR